MSQYCAVSDVVRIQMAASSTNTGISAANTGTTKTSASLSIIRVF